MFKGCFTALITPFKDGKVDEKAFQKFVDWQINEGIHGLVPAGTTGESATLSHPENNLVTELCIEAADKRVPVIAGCGSNSTEEAISLTRNAKKAGADAALIVTPYYNKPSQEGLYQHFMAIANNVDIPIMIYNIPGRSIIDMSLETFERLAKHPNIVGVKDATADLSRPQWYRLILDSKFCQLSGDDNTALPYLGAGGHGVISVSSNVAPKKCAEVQNLWQAGKIQEAQKLADELMPLHQNMFYNPSPACPKYGLSLLDICTEEVRLPIIQASDEGRKKVREAMSGLGLL